MSEQIKQIAMRIKELREIYNLTVEELAKEINISPQKYRTYEEGNTDIPVSVLYSIANRFNVELTAILTGDEPKLSLYSLVRKGEGIGVDRRKEYKYKSLAYNFIHKKAEPFLVTVEPDMSDSPIAQNSHTGQEFNYVLEGTLKIQIGGHEVILEEGDSIFYDSGNKHGMKALNNQPAKFLAVIM
ncbi:MAG: cupin domain-containing protein [Clostridiales bacterium]|nr:cupin domain-containing protein [Clostridiales bacterium]